MIITKNDNLHFLKIIALDFDGTLVESNPVKDQAFETIFSEWPEHKDAMMEWHFTRNSTGRREKFRHFVEEILELSGNIELIDKLTGRFSELTRKAIIDCPMVKGAQAFLDDCKGKVSLFLVSNTPQSELDLIIKERRLNGYFEEFYGAPIDKVQVLSKIMADEKASPDEMVYIGDSPEDQQASVTLSIHFIGRHSDRDLKGTDCPVYSDFVKIKEHFGHFYGFYKE